MTEPTDAEILDAADDFRSQYMHGGITFDEFDSIGFARAVLAKWGTPQPTQAPSTHALRASRGQAPAAGAVAGPVVKYVPVNSELRDANWDHPNDDEPRTPECWAALRERGDDEGQGLDGFWKWGFAAGFNAALAAAPQADSQTARIDCGEAGCAEGRCGNAKCLPSAAPLAAPDAQMIAEYGIKASRMMARDLTRFDAACEVDKYLREQGAPGYYRHRMSIILFGNVEGTEASRAPENEAPKPSPTPQADSVLEAAITYRKASDELLLAQAKLLGGQAIPIPQEWVAPFDSALRAQANLYTTISTAIAQQKAGE